MSEYLRVLTRLERETRPAAPLAAAAGAAPRPAPALVIVPSGHERATAWPHASDDRDEAFAALYDNLRARASGEAIRSLVVASAADDGSARTVVDGLAAHVRRLGLAVRIAELATVDGVPAVRIRTDAVHSESEAFPLDLRSRASAGEVRDWLTADADLTLIDGGALADSIDPALLACASDGVVIAVRAEVTAAEALRVAAERMRKVGCTALGIVVATDRDRVPPWARGSRWWPSRG